MILQTRELLTIRHDLTNYIAFNSLVVVLMIYQASDEEADKRGMTPALEEIVHGIGGIEGLLSVLYRGDTCHRYVQL